MREKLAAQRREPLERRVTLHVDAHYRHRSVHAHVARIILGCRINGTTASGAVIGDHRAHDFLVLLWPESFRPRGRRGFFAERFARCSSLIRHNPPCATNRMRRSTAFRRTKPALSKSASLTLASCNALSGGGTPSLSRRRYSGVPVPSNSQ